MKPHLKSVVLVTLQFAFLLALVAGTKTTKFSLFSILLFMLAIFLIGWAVLAMRKSKIRISPKPALKATLVKTGPYQFIRHPMYTSIIIGSSALLLQHYTLPRLAILSALIIVLIMKLNWEEKMLGIKFEDYKTYALKTKKMIPLVY